MTMEEYKYNSSEKPKPPEITREMVMESLIKDPSDYSTYIEWTDQERGKLAEEVTQFVRSDFEVKAAETLIESARASGDKILFQKALENLYDAGWDVNELKSNISQTDLPDEYERFLELSKTLSTKYEEILMEYDKKFPEEN